MNQMTPDETLREAHRLYQQLDAEKKARDEAMERAKGKSRYRGK